MLTCNFSFHFKIFLITSGLTANVKLLDKSRPKCSYTLKNEYVKNMNYTLRKKFILTCNFSFHFNILLIKSGLIICLVALYQKETIGISALLNRQKYYCFDRLGSLPTSSCIFCKCTQFRHIRLPRKNEQNPPSGFRDMQPAPLTPPSLS